MLLLHLCICIHSGLADFSCFVLIQWLTLRGFLKREPAGLGQTEACWRAAARNTWILQHVSQQYCCWWFFLLVYLFVVLLLLHFMGKTFKAALVQYWGFFCLFLIELLGLGNMCFLTWWVKFNCLLIIGCCLTRVWRRVVTYTLTLSLI